MGGKGLFSSYPHLIVFTFALLIGLSTIALLIPFSTVQQKISIIDALFTATSAACVTGLTVVDTSSYFTVVGQVIILITIQIGGLGIITLSNLFLVFAGKPITFTSKVTMYQTFGFLKGLTAIDIVKRVVILTFAIELCGALFLFISFYDNSLGLLKAIFISIFHSISAFCNAGFSLFSDNLIAYKSNIIVNLVVCALIFLGGIGFVVFFDIEQNITTSNKKKKNLTLHSKIVISTSVCLIAFGACFIGLTEYSKSFEGFPLRDVFFISLFHSVSARTAGFNTFDINLFSTQSLLLIIFLMFVGASPGGTGGGIKTTSFFTLICSGISKLRGQPKAMAFKRSIPDADVEKALGLFILSLILVVSGVWLLLEFELGKDNFYDRGLFLKYLFEVVSAFGTVGLSTGITPDLSPASKVVLILIMFVGRTGPLVWAATLTGKKQKPFYYATEEILIG